MKIRIQGNFYFATGSPVFELSVLHGKRLFEGAHKDLTIKLWLLVNWQGGYHPALQAEFQKKHS